MKISEVKVVYLVLVLVFCLWIWFFIDFEVTKYKMNFTGWQRDVAGAINDLNTRMRAIEGVKATQPPQLMPPQPKKEK